MFFKVFFLDIQIANGHTTHFGNIDRPFIYIEDSKMIGSFNAVNDGGIRNFEF